MGNKNPYIYRFGISDLILLLLAFAYMLHNSPYIGVRMSAISYAGIVILLFSYNWLLLSKYQNITKLLAPLLALYFLDLIFMKTNTISGTEGIMRMASGAMQIIIYPLLAVYAISRRNKKLILYLLLIYLSIEFITYLTSISAEMSFPGIVRLNPGQIREDDSTLYALKTSLNVGDFNPSLIPKIIFNDFYPI